MGNNAIDLALAHSPLCQQFAQEPAAWQFFHLQAVLGDFSFGLEGKIGSRLVDWKDVQVNIRTKSTIQLELAPAKVVSLFQGAEVEEAEVNRFFYFENERRGDEDPRNVGLPQQHPPRLVGIGSRRFQEIDQLSGSFRSLESDFTRAARVNSAFMPCLQRFSIIF